MQTEKTNDEYSRGQVSGNKEGKREKKKKKETGQRKHVGAN